MWKVGLVGAGYISGQHLEAWSKHENAKVAALCDLDEHKLNERGEQFGIPQSARYTDVDEMLASADIEIVDITTPPSSHLMLVRKASAAKKHILCQKPLAPTYEEAEEMVQTARAAGVRFMVTENWRWLAQMQNLKSVMQSGKVGKPFYAKYSTQHYFTPKISPDKQIAQPYFREMPKLVMYEMGTHWFDVWRFLFGEPNRLTAEMQTISPYIKGEDVGTVLIGHDDFHGVMEKSWASRRSFGKPHTEHFFIETDRNSLLVFGDGTVKLLDENGETVLNGPLGRDYGESFRRLQAHFLECLETGEEFQTSGEDNLKTLRLVFAAYESAEKGETIRLI